jgi:hypothetical protein
VVVGRSRSALASSLTPPLAALGYSIVLRFHTYAECAGHLYSERACDLASVSFINQEQAGFVLNSESDGFCLAWIACDFQLNDQWPVGSGDDLEPAGRFRISDRCGRNR